MDVIIFSGQSNMQGQTECLSENAEVNNAYEYKWLTNELAPLKNPVGENITYELTQGDPITDNTDLFAWLSKHAIGAACYGNTNLVPSFCRTYTELTGRSVVAVHAAKGSTEIADWMPDGGIYNVLKTKACDCIKKVKPERIFFVWLQGESDAITERSKAYYKEHLRILMDVLKKDIGVELFGMIRVGRFTYNDYDFEVISAQDEACSEYDDFVMLTDIATTLNNMPEYMNPYVGGHYSAKGQEKLGFEAAKTLADVVNG
ncbi:MAG: sialate O-acetylesterase [Clostridiales bacterium]|nr:sialate O-acetylesterase [Clostridiales bacterium]